MANDNSMKHDQPPRLLRTADVIKITSFSRHTINKLIAEGEFPEPVRVAGIRTQVWSAAAVFDWCDRVLNTTANADTSKTKRKKSNRKKERQPQSTFPLAEVAQ